MGRFLKRIESKKEEKKKSPEMNNTSLSSALRFFFYFYFSNTCTFTSLLGLSQYRDGCKYMKKCLFIVRLFLCFNKLVFPFHLDPLHIGNWGDNHR